MIAIVAGPAPEGPNPMKQQPAMIHTGVHRAPDRPCGTASQAARYLGVGRGRFNPSAVGPTERDRHPYPGNTQAVGCVARVSR